LRGATRTNGTRVASSKAMLRLIRRSVMSGLLASCNPGLDVHPTTVAAHERLARHYELTADSIEDECYKARRHELTVDEPAPCWKAHDIRFLEANRNAAAAHRAVAARLAASRSASAMK
jgi:hypothetical protein